jgi:hypothetical protein
MKGNRNKGKKTNIEIDYRSRNSIKGNLLKKSHPGNSFSLRSIRFKLIRIRSIRKTRNFRFIPLKNKIKVDSQ